MSYVTSLIIGLLEYHETPLTAGEEGHERCPRGRDHRGLALLAPPAQAAPAPDPSSLGTDF